MWLSNALQMVREMENTFQSTYLENPGQALQISKTSRENLTAFHFLQEIFAV